MPLPLRDKSSCHYDQISLGEVMLRLDPGEGRVRTARQFAAWEGGGEYNTSRGLRKCFEGLFAILVIRGKVCLLLILFKLHAFVCQPSFCDGITPRLWL
jgi:hypothetical protein